MTAYARYDVELRRIDDVVAAGPFADQWGSLAGYEVPGWYVDGKFGIFIHWGPYSVPAFGNEWYARNMYREGSREYHHHRETYGPQDRFGYKDFLPRFTADAYDPDAWAMLFRRSGATFVVPVAEHHDGFAMYDSGLSEWTAAKLGPKRDVIGELAEAVRRQFMVFGVSSHRAEHWWFMNGGMRFDSDVRDPAYAQLYGPAQPEELPPNEQFLTEWLVRTCEIVDRYAPELVWFDWWIEQPVFEPYLRRFAAYYYNAAAAGRRGVAINYKHDAFAPGSAVFDIERGQCADIRTPFWQTDTSVSKSSWGYTTNQDYKTVPDLVGDLIDIVSKNGALLLNIGPKADGTIPEPEQQLLLGIGDWLAVNGEAVYGTRPWRVYGEGPTQVPDGSFTDSARVGYTAADVRFTSRGDILYATALAWPDRRELVVRSLGVDSGLLPRQITTVELLGHPDPLAFQRRADGLGVTLPDRRPTPYAPVLRVTPEGAEPRPQH